MRDKDGSIEGMRTQNHAAVMIYQRDSNLRVHHIVSYRLISCHARTQSRDGVSMATRTKGHTHYISHLVASPSHHATDSHTTLADSIH